MPTTTRHLCDGQIVVEVQMKDGEVKLFLDGQSFELAGFVRDVVFFQRFVHVKRYEFAVNETLPSVAQENTSTTLKLGRNPTPCRSHNKLTCSCLHACSMPDIDPGFRTVFPLHKLRATFPVL